MSDKEKGRRILVYIRVYPSCSRLNVSKLVLAVLSLLSETCSANIIPLQHTPSRPQTSSSGSKTHSHPLSTLRKDFISLLILVYTTSTKIALTLRPSEPAYTASVSPIQDLTKYISSLTTCATLFDGHGLTLAKEIRQSAQDVCEAARALSQTFITITDSENTKSGEPLSSSGSSEDYLVRVGAIHELVEKIKRESSEDNVAAVRKRYAMDVLLMEDTMNEVAVMVEDSHGDDEDDEDDEGFEDEDFEDELEKLGLNSIKRLSLVELERVKKVCKIPSISISQHTQREMLRNLSPKPFTGPIAIPTVHHPSQTNHARPPQKGLPLPSRLRYTSRLPPRSLPFPLTRT